MSDKSELLLHLGYPKSGTTTLQAGVFPKCDHIFFAGKAGDTGKETITPEADRFRGFINYGSTYHIDQQRAQIIADLDSIWQASGKSTMLMSLEGLTNPFVDTTYSQPRDLYTKAQIIARMVEPIRARGTRVKILITLRAQKALMPSLFSQIYMHGFSTGLFKPSYDGFLDFMLDDDITGFGPDFFFDTYLDQLSALFGDDNVYAAEMKSLLSGQTGAASDAVATFLGITPETCRDLIDTSPTRNVRNSGKGRRMMTKSGGVRRFEEMTGIAMRRKAFRLQDRLNLRLGKPIMWQLPDRSDRINAYYAASNAALAEKYGIKL